MLTRIHWLLPKFVASLACFACSPEADPGGSTGSTCPTENPPTYETFGEEFLSNYCTSCHATNLEGTQREGAPSDHNFDTYEGFLDAASHIDNLAGAGPDATNESMPPGDPTPSLDERRKLGEWVACELEKLDSERE